MVRALGWLDAAADASGEPLELARLRLADIVASPEAALRAWLPQLAMSELGPRALALVADLFGGAGAGARRDRRHRATRTTPIAWPSPKACRTLRCGSRPPGWSRGSWPPRRRLQNWRPGQPGLGSAALAAALQAEAEVASDVRELIEGRDLAAGLAALVQRWIGGDGRIVPPPVGARRHHRAPHWPGRRATCSIELDLEDLTGRVPTTTVHVALGAQAWPDAPAGRRVDLATAGLAATMFRCARGGHRRLVRRLGSRADCRVSGSTTDGTPEQAARLARVLDALAGVSNDIALVALAGAGHAARVAAQAQTRQRDRSRAARHAACRRSR